MSRRLLDQTAMLTQPSALSVFQPIARRGGGGSLPSSSASTRRRTKPQPASARKPHSPPLSSRGSIRGTSPCRRSPHRCPHGGLGFGDPELPRLRDQARGDGRRREDRRGQRASGRGRSRTGDCDPRLVVPTVRGTGTARRVLRNQRFSQPEPRHGLAAIGLRARERKPEWCPPSGSKSRPGVAATPASASMRRENRAVVRRRETGIEVESAVHREHPRGRGPATPPSRIARLRAYPHRFELLRHGRRRPPGPRPARGRAPRCRGSAPGARRANQGLRHDHPADAPAGHATVFRERVDDDRVGIESAERGPARRS